MSVDIDDLICAGGILLMGIGLGVIYWPAALVVIGLIVLAFGLMRSRA